MWSGPRRFELIFSLAAAAEIEACVAKLTAGLTESQFHAPTESGGWSIAFSLEHLILTGEAMIANWVEALRGSPEPDSRPGPPYSWLQRAALYCMEPPYRLKTKTSGWATPFARRSIEDTQRRFYKMHRELVQCMKQCDPNSRTRVRSPFVRGIRYPLAFSFDLTLAHERRHIWKAWEFRKSLFDSKYSPVALAK
jgi:hypothetical protein